MQKNKKLAETRIDITDLFALFPNLSARGRGYLEAAKKLFIGNQMVREANIELAQLDGRPLTSEHRGISNGGGIVLTSAIRGLTKMPHDAETLKAFLREGPMSSNELGQRAGCRADVVRQTLNKADGVRRVGTGAKTQWALADEKSRIVRKSTVAARTATRKAPPAPKKKPAPKKTKTGRAVPGTVKPPKAISAEAEAQVRAKVLAFVEKNPGKSIGDIMRGVKHSYYTVKRAITALDADKKIASSKLKGKNGGARDIWKVV